MLTRLSTFASKLAGPPLRRLFCGFTLRYRKTINTAPAGYNGVQAVEKLRKAVVFDKIRHRHIGFIYAQFQTG